MSRVRWGSVIGPAALLALMLLGIGAANGQAVKRQTSNVKPQTGDARRVAQGPWASGVPGLTQRLPITPHVSRFTFHEPATDPSGPSPTPTPGCGPAWRVVNSPNSGTASNDLYGIAALSATDMWAVGGVVSQPLTMHWDGAQWSIVPSPSAGALYGVTAISSANVWAAGYIGEFPGPYQTVIERWDGSQWNVVPSPNPELGAQLLAISAVSANDIWAVGQFYINNVHQTLTLRWDGSQWNVVPSPNAAPNTELAGVVALSADNVWAVGGYINPLRRYVPLILHWDGTQWSIVPSPDLLGYLYGVGGASPNDLWAVGYVNDGTSIHTLIEHWDGSTWTQVPSPNPGPVENFIYSVSALSSTDAWAVGSGNGTLTMRWDGSQWTHVPSPNVEGGGSLGAVAALSAGNVWAVGDYYNNQGAYRTLIEQYSAPICSTPTPTATDTPLPTITPTPTRTATQTATFTATNTPIPSVTRTATPSSTPSSTSTATGTETHISTLTVTSTPTSTPPSTSTATGTATQVATITPTGTQTSTPVATNTNTPLATVARTATPTTTPCAMSFTDVHQTDYFYEPVRYLYCRGVISGYADGTFKPYNLTTRGQLAKIIVLAEGWPIYTPPTPTFQDVPTTHTFYTFIETAYHQGIISGYVCSASTEYRVPSTELSDRALGTRYSVLGTSQCLEYRPGNNVTRAQLCKIIVLAEGWPTYTPPTPTFRDVPAADPFFGYVETAYSRSVVSGYDCGPGCLEFRPGNNATRGQICKIVYIAITSGGQSAEGRRQ